MIIIPFKKAFCSVFQSFLKHMENFAFWFCRDLAQDWNDMQTNVQGRYSSF